ncbi:integrase [Pseudomonas alkylphenolica]|uniref:Integrase n=1 Tax=Pseudomonas alkylphenolica TaxID=237609 RepID=A0A443ZVW3_9PSED|nr:integrase [Pseudomonas alkylphenolica]RWU24950.1 integrase [Pseudomonas alkylphenolica]
MKLSSTASLQHGIDAYMGIPSDLITPATVISRDIHGNILSVVGDIEWQTPLLRSHQNRKAYISFSKFRTSTELEVKNLEQTQKIVAIWIHRPSQRTGSYPSIDTVRSFLTDLRRLCNQATKKGVTLAELLKHPVHFKSHIDKIKSYTTLRTLQMIINKVIEEHIFSVSTTITKILDRAIRESADESEQHPVIPGRILFEKISHYTSLLQEYQENEIQISELNRRAGLNRFYGRFKRKSTDPHNPNVEFEVAMEECGLSVIREKYKMRQLSNVSNFISRCNYAAKMLIHIFTAMREREAYLLKDGCVEKIGPKTYVVDGLTVKLTKEPRPAKWITSESILLPYDCACSIARLIKVYMPACIDTENRLFLSVSYLPVANEYEKKQKDTELYQGALNPTRWEETFPPTAITDEDYEELVMIDPLRNWAANLKFQIGQNWNLTTHQFRRSMAVYAAQSGLVSLPSLKRMLHHTLLQMSIYYTRGFASAKFLFSEQNPDLAEFFQAQTVNAEASLFLKEVIMEKANLHGAAGIWYERNLKKEYATNIVTNFQETLKKIKQGLLSYKETILGGCFKVGECKERVHHNYVACVDCSSACIKEKKLDQSILIQTKIIDSIPEGTFAHNTEQTKLSMLQFFKDKISKVIA